jgi:hypothetical protein
LGRIIASIEKNAEGNQYAKVSDGRVLVMIFVAQVMAVEVFYIILRR